MPDQPKVAQPPIAHVCVHTPTNSWAPLWGPGGEVRPAEDAEGQRVTAVALGFKS